MSTIILGTCRSTGVPLWAACNHDGDVACTPLRVSQEGVATLAISERQLPHRPWTGVNNRGIFVGLTERADVVPVSGQIPYSEISRAALQGLTAANARDRVLALRAGSYDGFNLVIADLTEAFLIVGDGHQRMVPRQPKPRFGCVQLDPGVHVITEFGAEPGHCARERLIRDRLADAPDANGGFSSKKLFGILRFHAPEERGDGSVCLHEDRPGGRKTQASVVAALRRSHGSYPQWTWRQQICRADRTNCEGRWEKRLPLILRG